jgi:hypothetical protein
MMGHMLWGVPELKRSTDEPSAKLRDAKTQSHGPHASLGQPTRKRGASEIQAGGFTIPSLR